MFDEVDFFEFIYQHERLKFELENETNEQAKQKGMIGLDSLIQTKRG